MTASTATDPDRPPGLENALAARDRHLAIATHELRTPIASIRLNLELLERTARMRGSLPADTVSSMLAVPTRQLRRLVHMVDQLLETAQVENEFLVLRREPVDLCAVLNDVCARFEEMARAAGCHLVVDHCGPLVGDWDRMRLEQVLANLLTNAIKYGGGRVDVSLHRQGPLACLKVRDQGAGIAPQDQQRIFEAYERLASAMTEDGAGLGLYIVREIVTAHGGTVQVESAAGRGSTFRVELPLNAP